MAIHQITRSRASSNEVWSSINESHEHVFLLYSHVHAYMCELKHSTWQGKSHVSQKWITWAPAPFVWRFGQPGIWHLRRFVITPILWRWWPGFDTRFCFESNRFVVDDNRWRATVRRKDNWSMRESPHSIVARWIRKAFDMNVSNIHAMIGQYHFFPWKHIWYNWMRESRMSTPPMNWL